MKANTITVSRDKGFNFDDFYIDLATSDDEVLYVDVDGFTVNIRREAEGINVSIFLSISLMLL